MTALIADTSPILRNIPSDPPSDRRGIEFSPSPMPARYLPEGNQDHRRSPSPRGYSTREMPTLYRQRYGYGIAGTYGHADPGMARISCKACQCQQHCSCNPDPKTTQEVVQQKKGEGSAEAPPAAMWHSKEEDSKNNMTVARRASLFHAEAVDAPRPVEAASTAVSVSAPSRSPSPSAVLPHQRRPRDGHHVMPTVELTSSASKKSDWENLLGAVDLELRAQQRAELVPDSAPPLTLPSHHFAHAINAAHHHHQLQHQQEQHQQHQHHHHNLQRGRAPLHPSSIGGDNRYSQSAASVSPEFGPIKTSSARHHRRGGAGAAHDISGDPSAYSGSTADAASLLATLPQRMLDRASMVSKHGSSDNIHHPTASPTGAVGVALPAPCAPQAVLVSAASPPVTPVRVQASGRRGPRGQSRFKGVCITRAGKWRAVIYIGRKQKYLGVFDSEFDAARAYDAAALQHFAEGAKLNFPDGIERQLNEISSISGRPFATAGAGGAVAPRSPTPPGFADAGAEGSASGTGSSPASAMSGKRSRKSAFGDDAGDEWVREDGPWNPSRR